MLGSRPVATYELAFYEDEDGDKPVLRWLREELTRAQRFDLGRALRQQLREKGVGVCATAYGKQLGKGLFEFRLRRDATSGALPGRHSRGEPRVLLRVFCHAYGNKVVLLLGGTTRVQIRRLGGRARRSPSRALGSRTGGGTARADPRCGKVHTRSGERGAR